MPITRRCKGNWGFRLACDSLLSCRENNCPHQFAVLASVVIGHFALFDARPFDSDTKAFLYQAHFWLLFASSVVVLIVQMIRRDAIRKCHRRLVLSLVVEFPSIRFGYLMSAILEGIRTGNRELETFPGLGATQNRSQLGVLQVKRKQFSAEMSTKKDVSKIHEEYMELTDLANCVVSTYSEQILVVLFLFFLELLFILQITFFDILRGMHFFDSKLDFGLRTYLLLSYFYKLWNVIKRGQHYLDECSRTATILCKRQNFCTGERSQVRDFIMQRIQEPSEVSIMGLFQLDYRLLYGIVCGAINYGLIIGMFHLGGLKKQKLHY